MVDPPLNAEATAVYTDLAKSRDRRDKWFLRFIVGVSFVGVLLLGGMFFNGYQTHQTVNQIHTLISSHSVTLQHIDAIDKQLKTDLGYASTGYNRGVADYQEICNHIPGCKLPYPAP